MAEVLLLNPAKRRKARRKNPSPAQRAARAKFAAMARARSVSARRANPKRRRRNPAPMVSYEANPRRRRARRRNPIAAYRRVTRRRNPIGLGSVSLNGIMAVAKEAAVMGAGAVAMDVAYGHVQKYLPASLQAGPNQATVGAAVKAVLTVAAGQMLSRSTGGLSRKAALGALTVQMRDLVSGMLPAGTVAGLGYAVPGRVVNRSARIGPNQTTMNAYTPPGSKTPLLNAYTAPGSMSPLLSGVRDARAREGFAR